MAHIPDGILSLPVTATGAAITVVALGYVLTRIGSEELPRIAVMSALFFVASVIAIPVGPTSTHLLIAGLMGLVLGPAAIPAVLVGLILQLALFGIGGLTSLGVNTANIAIPAVVLASVFRPLILSDPTPVRVAFWTALLSVLAIALTGFLVAISLMLSDPGYSTALHLIVFSYAPLMVVEGFVCAAAASFLVRVKPEILGMPPHATSS